MTATANEEALVGGTTQGFRRQTETGSFDSAAVDADCKELSRLRAQLALRGHYVHRTAPTAGPARFIVTRGAWLVELADLPSLRKFVVRVGGAA